MDYPIYSIEEGALPERLGEIPDAPRLLHARGALPDWSKPTLAIVGSRKYSPYGKSVCEYLINGLMGNDIYIVSGLALGIDSIAHNAAIDANLKTIAIPGSGLDDRVLYPRSHTRLAQNILTHEGTLLSEFKPTTQAAPWCFPQRNRIMAGLAHAVLIIECEIKSGTHITARLATEYNRDVLTVPGSIFAPTASGPHALLKLGATPVTCAKDILEGMGIAAAAPAAGAAATLSPQEQSILAHLPATRDELAHTLDLPIHELNILISTMEIKGLVNESLGLISSHSQA